MLRVLVLSALTPFAVAAPPSDRGEFFEKTIRPILVQNCGDCHGAWIQKAGLSMATAAGFEKGSARGKIVDREHPERSRILEVIGYEGKVKMPPTGKLTPDQIEAIARWIKEGAEWPAQTASTAGGKKFTQGQRAFWSLQKVKDRQPPAASNSAWIANGIDNFVLAKMEAAGLAPAPPASRLALLRRVTLDLTGLPPTEREIADWLADASTGAYVKLIDRLLESPRYGERWGRHWLDVARYADSTGADEDHRYPHAWRYRDYVVESFQRDLPYDKFVLEQIAGDLLPGEKAGEMNTRGVVATGFLALGPKLIAEQDKPKMVYDAIDEQIEVVGKSIMGLTISCARCHDHKFDPISQKDYYSLASIFASTRNFSKVEGTVSEFEETPLVPKAVFEAYDRHQKKITAKRAEADQILEDEWWKYSEALRPKLLDYLNAAWTVKHGGSAAAGLDAKLVGKWVAYLHPKERKPHLDDWARATEANIAKVAETYRDDYMASLKKWETSLAKWRERAEAAIKDGKTPPNPPKLDADRHRFFAETSYGGGPFAMAKSRLPAAAKARFDAMEAEIAELRKASPAAPPMADAVAEGASVEQHVFLRGDVRSLGDVVPKRFPVILAGEEQTPITRGSGRLELAKWLASPEHPLTARVMVNRVWQWHFGEGLVRTPSNWGLLGEKPTHPELLDWLAARFVESGWSIKALHRLILLSSTYRQSSEVTSEKAAKDPANTALSHYSRRRMDVEEIRDSMLAIDGSLSFEGPGRDAQMAKPDVSARRSMYLLVRRANVPTLFNLFDFVDATTTSEGRARTNVAPQALFMMNSAFVRERSRSLATTLFADISDDDRASLRRLYLMTIGRPPRQDEVSSALDYVAGFRGESRRQAWHSYVRILLASNEFLYVD